MNTKIKYYHNIDGLRTIAAFGVIVAHFFNSSNVNGNQVLLKIAGLGNSGVSLFFVLSGFVITRILFNTIKSENYFKAFYMRRTLRIFPLYYFALICYYFLPPLLGSFNPPPFSEQYPYWFYLQNFARTFGWSSSGPGHFWSLAVEEHFYLLWPALVFFFYDKKLKRIINISIILFILPFILRYYMLSKGMEINVFTFTRLDQLVLGGALAIVEVKGLLVKKNYKYFLALFFIGAIFIGLTSFMNYFNLNLFKHYAFGICYFGLIGFCAIASNKMFLNRILLMNAMQYLGKISYGIYVWHILAIDLVKDYLGTKIVFFDFFLVVLITIVISMLSYGFIEKPFLNLKKYYKYN